MGKTIHPIGVTQIIYKYFQNEDIFDIIPEFAFLKPLGSKWKKQGCACGLGSELSQAIFTYNSVVSSADEELASRLRQVFETEGEICLSIQEKDNHTIKCF